MIERAIHLVILCCIAAGFVLAVIWLAQQVGV